MQVAQSIALRGVDKADKVSKGVRLKRADDVLKRATRRLELQAWPEIGWYRG